MVRIIVCNYRQPPCTALLRWLAGRPWETGSQEYGIACARNQNINRFLSDGIGDYLLMLDADIVPVDYSILDADGDCLYCGYVGTQGSTGHVDSFGAGCSRYSRKMLQAFSKPYFKMEYNDAHDLRLKCECQYFEEKIRAAGFVPRCVGFAGHQIGGDTGPILYPNGSAKWPHQVG